MKRIRKCLAGLLALALLLTGCAPASETGDWSGMTPVSRLEPEYARQFSIDYYEQGYKLITIESSGHYLVIPEDGAIPGNLPADITPLRQPLDCIYLVATAAMDLFRALDAIGNIRLSGTDAAGWYIPEAVAALESGDMLYAGKYSAPDYERILAEGCDLAIESTMIYHSPEVKEQLERLGIPVLVERSSYESDPLGRMEWIKLYGALLNRESQAQQLFDRAQSALASLPDRPDSGKTVAFFYINSVGTVSVRKSGDYVAEMIRLAGGRYVPENLGDNGNFLSTMNMDMESFYAAAKDADILIYNSTIDGELTRMDQLLQNSSLLADFKAVQNGDVWCTGRNMFQETMGLWEMILELHSVITEAQPGNLSYLHRLQ